jgi:Flp pilus assembly protein TadD
MNNEIKTRSKKNLLQARLFSEMLANGIRKYQNRAIETARVIKEPIGLAKEMRGRLETEIGALEMDRDSLQKRMDEIEKTLLHLQGKPLTRRGNSMTALQSALLLIRGHPQETDGRFWSRSAAEHLHR